MTHFDIKEEHPIFGLVDAGKLEFIKAQYAEDPSIIDICGQGEISLLHLAAACGHLDIVQWLTSTAGPALLCKKDAQGRTVLRHAVLAGHASVTEWLLNNGAQSLLDEDKTLLLDAASRPNLKIVECLVTAGGTQLLDVVGNNGMTAMMVAASEGELCHLQYMFMVGGRDRLLKKDANNHSLFKYAFCERQLNVVHWLLKEIADPIFIEEKNTFRLTLLLEAAYEDNFEVVQWIINDDPNMLSVPNGLGQTVIMYAARGGNPHIVRWLVEKGGLELLWQRDMEENTALLSTISYAMNLEDYLDEFFEITPDNIAVLLWLLGLDDSALLDQKDRDGWNIIAHAVANKQFTLLKTLIQSRRLQFPVESEHDSSYNIMFTLVQEYDLTDKNNCNVLTLLYDEAVKQGVALTMFEDLMAEIRSDCIRQPKAKRPKTVSDFFPLALNDIEDAPLSFVSSPKTQ